MDEKLYKNAAAIVAAVATTFVLFSAVAGLADEDRAQLLAAKSKPTLVAQGGSETASR